jgi:hypothetical protein
MIPYVTAATSPVDRALYLLVYFLGWLQALCLAAVRVPLWRSANGTTKPIREMDDQHLTNAIRMIAREPKCQQHEAMRELLREYSRRRLPISGLDEPKRYGRRGWYK